MATPDPAARTASRPASRRLSTPGSRGADNADEIVTHRQGGAKPRCCVLLNLGRTGLGGRGELLDFANADAAAARKVIEAHREVIIGIKARLSRSVVGVRDLDAIDRAHEVTVPVRTFR